MACPLHEPRWDDFQVEGKFPGHMTSAQEALSKSCIAQFYAFRKFCADSKLIADEPCPPLSLAVEEITVEIEKIPICYTCGLYAKRIAHEDWSVTGPAFYVGGDRIPSGGR